MRLRGIIAACAIVVLIRVPVYAYECRECSSLRQSVMDTTLLAMGYGKAAVEKVSRDRFGANDILSDDCEGTRLSISVDGRIGYMRGETAYDFNHHTSELVFPFDNWMSGVGVRAARGPLSLNGEVWTAMIDDDASDMKNRDWIDGILVSESISQSRLDALILDGNIRYDFFRAFLEDTYDEVALQEGDRVSVGALLGYRYERYDYDLYDLFYQVDLFFGNEGDTLYSGSKIGTYRIEYFLPYIGLACDIERGIWGVGAQVKYSFYPSAEDRDNHLLRGLTFYGEYDKHGSVWFGNLYTFWKFYPQWRLKAGIDLMSARIDGITYEEARDPSWDADQSTDMHYFIVWAAVDYTF